MKTKMTKGDKVKLARPDVVDQLLNEGWEIDGPKIEQEPKQTEKRRGRPSKKEEYNG